MHSLDAPTPAAATLNAAEVITGPHPESATSTREALSLALQLRGIEHLIGERIAAGISPLLDSLDITPERWRVMAALAVEPGPTMTQLSRLAVLPPASLTRHVDRLVAAGLVERVMNTSDRRRVTAQLTARGLQAWTQIRAREREVINELRTLDGAENFDALMAGLSRLRSLLSPS